MPKKSRIDAAGALHHIIAGGINGKVYSGTIKTEIIFWNGSTIKIHNLILKALVCKGGVGSKTT